MLESFSQLPLRSDVVGALGGVGVTRPTVIQMLAMPKIARGKNVLIASETGSYDIWQQLQLAVYGRLIASQGLEWDSAYPGNLLHSLHRYQITHTYYT